MKEASSPERRELEEAIHVERNRGDHAEAATAAIRGYGPEIMGFLLALHRDEEDAAEVFARFSERLWRDLPAFRGDSSFRTWAYALARHAAFNYRRDERRRQGRQQPLPESSRVSALVQEVRSETASYLRSERKARFAALRDSLPPEDRTLLVLRVDRGLAWNDLARVMHDGAQPLGEAEVKRDAARLRKRFQLLKARLLELGRAAGVVSDDRGG